MENCLFDIALMMIDINRLRSVAAVKCLISVFILSFSSSFGATLEFSVHWKCRQAFEHFETIIRNATSGE